MHHSALSRPSWVSLKQVMAVLSLIIGTLLPTAAGATSAGDTSANAMICGGVFSQAEFVHKLNHGDCRGHSASELKMDYATYNVTTSNFNNGNTVSGIVTKSGDVLVDGKVVATNAFSFGRTNLPGSTAVANGLFKRPTEVSFASDQLSAFVHIVNGRFRFAIVKSCGNLVIATPKMAPTPAHKPTPTPTPAPTPAVTQTQNVNVVQVQAPTTTQVVKSTTPPAATPTPTPAPAAAPVAATLPSTGATTAGLASLSVLLTAGWYYYRSRRDVQWALRRITST